MEYFFAAFLLLSACADRFVLRRREISIHNIYFAGDDESSYKFAINFSIEQHLQDSSIIYTLRDVKNPSTVISGKPRTLEFSQLGGNEEYLIFPKHLISAGRWRLDVKITSSGSRLNPFYKIFPIKKIISKDLDVL